ncbi:MULTISPECIES: hypothetical protein [unclassified Acidovorax]|uniref:hypothetical protein n=1 Tax=unclassified Acidovorax TaxID=2684926 RepID=UPI001C479C61|nr:MULTISPECIES: hypothetical protein [unclassified Acidovorax]MBV7459469.1 hypothetical protein [Acidovorax sp. sif0632]MBV7464494.1 hypothetical protein [Acidovorax sp. sif0613]
MGNEQRIQTLIQALENAELRIKAIENSLGALVIMGIRHMPAERRAAFGDGLAAIAATAEKQGDIASATLMTDLHRAASQASGA